MIKEPNRFPISDWKTINVRWLGSEIVIVSKTALSDFVFFLSILKIEGGSEYKMRQNGN